MTDREKWEKRNLFIFIIGYFSVSYLVTNWLNDFRSHYNEVAFPFESQIPFIPLFILGYIFAYLSVVFLYFLIDDMDLFRRTFVAYFALTTFACLIFMIFPVKMHFRPSLESLPADGIIADIVRAFFIVDRPNNAFPSLHVGYPMLSAISVWKTRPIWRWILLGMTIVVAVSVVLVKQHYIVDTFAGAASAFICYSLVLRTERWWRKIFKP